jgi:hypothetical protein
MGNWIFCTMGLFFFFFFCPSGFWLNYPEIMY